MIWIVHKSAKKLFICLSTGVFKHHASIRASKLPASASSSLLKETRKQRLANT